MRRRWKGSMVVVMAGWMLACSGSPTVVEIGRLEGSWEWRSATGGIAGRTITPATEGYSMELRFLAGRKAELYRDGILRNATDFHLEVGMEGGSFPGRDVVRFDPSLFGGWNEMGVELAGSSLILADGCCDGYTYSFERR